MPNATSTDAEIESHLRSGRSSSWIMAQCKASQLRVRAIRKRIGVAVPVGVNQYTEEPTAFRLPEPMPEGGGPELPDPVPQSYEPFRIDTAGRWLILSDTHMPYHDKRTIMEAVGEAKRVGATGILLNGDILDCYQLSSHFKEPDKGRFKEEIEVGKAFLDWLRAQFPKARIVFKEGNHDERLRRYLAERAPALFGIDEVDLRNILGLANRGIEWVGDKRVIQLGKLPVVHGHEFRGGGGVNPARWLFLRAVSTALCGHFHRTSEHNEQGLDMRLHGVWSVGCACFLYPQYDPNNKWNHGYALADVAADGTFQITNRKILRDGRLV